jgi:phage terminase large subunit
VLCWVWIEEAFELDDEKEFRTLDESIRGMMPDGLFKQITLTYNPWVNNHWTKTRFWDQEDPDADRFTTTYRINEWLDEDDKRKIEILKETDPERYMVVGEGEYGIPGGAYFNNFRRSIHVIEPFIIPSHWQRFSVSDYGLDMLATVFIAIDDRGKGYAYKEIYKPDLIISEAANEIIRVTGNDKIIRHYAPTDLDNRRQETGKSAYDIFREHKVNFVKASRDFENGCLSMKEWLKVREERDIRTGETIQTADFKFFSNCTNAIRCLPQIQVDEINPNVYAKQPHELTHIVDALRYFMIMRHNPSKEKEKPLHRENQRPLSVKPSSDLDESYVNMRVRV